MSLDTMGDFIWKPLVFRLVTLFLGSSPSAAGCLLRLAQVSRCFSPESVFPSREAALRPQLSLRSQGPCLQLRAWPLAGGQHLTAESWGCGKCRRLSLPMVLSPLGTPIQASPKQET